MPDVKAYDMVIIGAGGAGVSAAVVAARAGVRVALLSKEPAGRGNTAISGGIMSNPGLVPGDGTAQFKQDLFLGGEQTGDPRLIDAVAEGASSATAMLESFGALFSRDDKGDLTGETVIRQGGHAFPRTMVMGRHRGIPIGSAVRAAMAGGRIDVFDEVVATRLLKEDGRVNGVVALNLIDGEPLLFSASAAVLATGGCPWIYYPHCGAMRSTVGDGYALGYWAGAELIDMEQTQYGTEAGFYGPYARLVNGAGEVVREELGYITRAQLGRIIALEVAQGKGTPRGGITVDPRPNLDREEGKEIYRKVEASGMLDVIAKRPGYAAGARWEGPMDVRCSAHFTMGGIRTDEWGRTNVPGLYAAGEVAGGLHGANRLGSVALTEIFVMGPRVAEHISKNITSAPAVPVETLERARESVHSIFGQDGRARPITLVRRLQRTLWRTVGPVRTRDLCREAIAEIGELAASGRDLRVSNLRAYNTEALDAIELGFMLVVGEMIARSALSREETRGAHLRLDKPGTDETRHNVVVWQDNGEMNVRLDPSPGHVPEKEGQAS